MYSETSYIKKRFLVKFVLIVLIITTLGCYQPAHTAYKSNNITYQFDEPRDYCQRTLSDSGFTMTCDEGIMIFEFLSFSSPPSTNDVLTHFRIPSNTLTTQYTLQGDHSPVIWLEVFSTSADTPDFIAVKSFTPPNVYGVVTGYNSYQSGDDISEIMTDLVVTLKP